MMDFDCAEAYIAKQSARGLVGVGSECLCPFLFWKRGERSGLSIEQSDLD